MAVAAPTLLFKDRVLEPDQADFIMNSTQIGFSSWETISSTFNAQWHENTTPQDISDWYEAREQEFKRGSTTPAAPRLIFQDRLLEADQANYIFSLSWAGVASYSVISRTFNLHWHQNTTPEDIGTWCQARKGEFDLYWPEACPIEVWRDEFEEEQNPSGLGRDWIEQYVLIRLRSALILFDRKKRLPSNNEALFTHLSYLVTTSGYAQGLGTVTNNLENYDWSTLWALTHEKGRLAYMDQFGRIGPTHPSGFRITGPRPESSRLLEDRSCKTPGMWL
ncbi:MAG: hypothetical protein Q9218_002768 [Villophora microphyllina]